MKKNILEYNFPEDLKKMTSYELELLSYEIRDFLITNISKTGGHLASNLGVVEITIALHRIFDSPSDKIIWDVGHQSYVHKILTGRGEKFDTLRKLDGISGFPKTKESVHDHFNTGHSSTSLSFASGMAEARDLEHDDYNVIAVIGDGALTGGLAYEALNNIGDSKSHVIVILNDNGMSIAPNIGGISTHLNKLRSSAKYLNFKKQIRRTIKGIPGIGEGLFDGLKHLRDSVKYSMLSGVLFEELGFKYFGPIDGHNIEDLSEIMEFAKGLDQPIVIHAITKKGKGYRNAELTPITFHGTGPFDTKTGEILARKQGLTYSEVFGNKMVRMALENEKIVAVSAAMLEGTGLESFAEAFPDRTFDVGIAEAHGVTFSAGMAASGYRPVAAIYSTFLQRAYDQIMEDVCLQGLPVIFAIDRAGVVGNDGETHHGLFDISYLNHMPNMTVLAPMNGEELEAMMEYAMTLNGPCAIRYPRGKAAVGHISEPINGKSSVLKTGKDLEIWAVGNMVETALKVSDILNCSGIKAGVINARFIKPLDKEGLLSSAQRTSTLFTIEDNVVTGGFGEAVKVYLANHGYGKNVHVIGWPDTFIEHGTCSQLMKKYGLDTDGIVERIRDTIERKA